MRAFIAVDLDPGLKAAVMELVRKLEAARADVRWTKPGGIHLTLKFLGEISDEEAVRAKAVLKDVSSRHKPFSLRLAGTGAFPGGRNPRVLWVGISADPELSSIQDDLEAGFGSQGFPREDRAFKPHLTLGRVKGRDRLDKAMAELAKHVGEDLGGMTVRGIALFESRLRPEGADYRIVEEALFP